MSSEPAIIVENLAKCYQIYDSPGSRLKQMLMRGRRKYYREFWALRDISFTIARGKSVGIVGQNGSGKSTLLQILCGTLGATSGFYRTNGRIAALLELGSGFNPEFTGRENVYMNGSVLGLTSREIDERFTAIADFAAIGNFIEQPVKTYSSGMMVRLAFAVAINVDPEILVIDEALAVGDELFQRKCFSRIESIRQRGATILFVSHSVGAVLELCDTAILLDQGEKLAEGSPKYITSRYQKLIYSPADRRESVRNSIIREKEEEVAEERREEREIPICPASTPDESCEGYDPSLVPASTMEYLSGGAKIFGSVILNARGERVNILVRGKTYRYCYRVHFSRFSAHINFGMMIKTLSGVELGGTVSASGGEAALVLAEKGSEYEVEIDFICRLSPGVYFLNAGVTGDVDGETGFLHRLLDAAIFRVAPEPGSLVTGNIDFSCRCRVKPV
ncbi:MAG: ABC transporter ATP-binding protein [Deltaproteobacteria bacterium]|nr:MAG: ABC transporter ATP-binding protein [Deltaproteobacteria bacterium]